MTITLFDDTQSLLLLAWLLLRPDPDCASMPDGSIEELNESLEGASLLEKEGKREVWTWFGGDFGRGDTDRFASDTEEARSRKTGAHL